METNFALAALSALAHPTRLSVFRLLVEAGPAGRLAGDIAATLDVPPATLSFHLKELAAGALVHGEASGRTVIYRADYASMNGLIEYLTHNCCRGETRCPAPPEHPPSARTSSRRRPA